MPDTQHCPQCGTPAPGAFCPACGTATGTSTCAGCSADLSAGARFCHRCGRPVRPGRRTPWLVAVGVLLVSLVGVGAIMAGGIGPRDRPDMANVGAPSGRGTAPDISRMSPRERFDRLFNRVMEAGSRGDSAEVVDFTPMALGAYSQLEAYDPSSRMQAALIRIQVGEYRGAMALADTILLEAPGNLFGYVIRGSVAHIQGDSTTLRQSFRDFLGRYDETQVAEGPEYRRDRDLIDQFHRAAQAAAPSP